MNNKLVSIILPTYNRAYVLNRAIDSVMGQTFKDWELIIIDDNSKDNTEDFIKGINDKRIKYIKNIKNLGGAEARNVGIRIAQGSYIAFLDSDDEWLPQKLEKQVVVLDSKKDIGCVYVDFHTANFEKKQTYSPIKKEGYIYSELQRANFITLPSLMVRRECLESAGIFDKSLPRLQDWDLLLRLSLKYKISFIDEKLLNVFYSEDSITANRKSYSVALELILDKYQDEYRKVPEIYARHLFNLANSLSYEEDSAFKVKKFLLLAWKNNKKNILYFICYVVSLFGRRGYNLFLRSYKRLNKLT